MLSHFRVSRARLKRAISHAESIAAAWNAIREEDLFSVVNQITASGSGRVRLVANKPISDESSLSLGELLYQLRAALDALIYQATIYSTGKNPPPNENDLEFPICSNAKEFKKQAKRRLFALPQDVQDAIMQVQPYMPSLPPEEMVKSINRSLSILHDLARKDRHRKLHAVGSWAFVINPEFRLPPGVSLVSLNVMPMGQLEYDNYLATFQLSGFRPGMNVQINPNVATTLGLNEPPPPCHDTDTFAKRLTEMINAVGSIIAAFERYPFEAIVKP